MDGTAPLVLEATGVVAVDALLGGGDVEEVRVVVRAVRAATLNLNGDVVLINRRDTYIMGLSWDFLVSAILNLACSLDCSLEMTTEY